MKTKKIFAGMSASLIALSILATAGITASAAEPVKGNAGIAFQTNETWNFRNPFGTDVSSAKQPAAFPNKVVGVQGGEYGFDTSVDCGDIEINGSGTYTVSIAASGKINSDAAEFDDGTTRDDESWQMNKSTELDEANAKTTDKFNFLYVTTDIACEYNDEDLPTVNGEVVKCIDAKIKLGSKEYSLEAITQKSDEDYLCFEIVNTWNSDKPGLTDTELYVPGEGEKVEVTFTLEGLGVAENKDSSTVDSKTDSSSTDSSTNNTGSSSKTTTGTNNSSDNSGETGAAAGIALAGIALAGAALIVSKKK